MVFSVWRKAALPVARSLPRSGKPLIVWHLERLAAAGFRGLTVDELVDLKAVGVTADFALEARRRGLANCAEELADLRSSGMMRREG